MPSMQQHKHRQERYQSPRATTIPLQSLWTISGSRTQAKGEKKQKVIILKAYQERMSLRGLARVFGILRQSIARWIKEHVQGLPSLRATMLPAQLSDVLEFDETWSFVFKKANKSWLWTVMCRRTRQILAFEIGDRSEKPR